jgi:hypothetical protein
MANEIKRVASNCKVTCENNNTTVEAEVMDFQEGKKLTVVLNKSIKITMPWNGRIYEGKSSGLSFVSTGPKIEISTTGR